MPLLAVFIGLLFCYSLVSGRLDRTLLTAPILFTTAGMLVCPLMPELHGWKENLEVFRRLAELGLVMLLFTDASRTDLQVLRSIRNLPVRLLSVGMLLTIGLGAVAALLLLPKLSLLEAGILAAILAPTDAGLGQIIVNSPRVPARVRQALNVEAGLNDGLSVPFMLFFIEVAKSRGGAQEHGLLQVMGEQLGLGALIGLAIGLAGGFLLGLAHRRQWTSESFQQIGVCTVPLLCAIICEEFGASIFIGAFVAGLAVQVGFKEVGTHDIEFTEEWGQMFNLSVFFLFGLLAAHNYDQLSFSLALYAIASLTVVRMLPVAVSLFGTGLSSSTIAFIGWFGPRGLASIVLGLVYLGHEASLPGEHTITLAVMTTVFISIFVHGLSAKPGIERYAARLAKLDSSAPEHQCLSVNT